MTQLFPSPPAPSLDTILEKELTSQIVQLARTLNWLRYHSWSSKHSPSGFPDEVLVRERTVFLELKRERGKPTDVQKEWLRALLNAGAEVYLIRPRDLQSLALILAYRGDPWKTARGPALHAASRLRDTTRKEANA